MSGVDVLLRLDALVHTLPIIADAASKSLPELSPARSVSELKEVRAAVAELIEAGGRLQFTKRDGKFVPVDTGAIAGFVTALARATGGV